MEFRLLGPLDVRHNDAPVHLGARKQRVVLALLAVQANRPVTLEQITDELWGEHPPRSAVINARQYAATLRRMLEKAESRPGRIVRAGSGYQLCAEPSEVDLIAYKEEVHRGQQALAAGEVSAARDQFQHAIRRWQGPLVDGLPRGSELTVRCAALEHSHIASSHTLAELHLRLGEYLEAITLLSHLLLVDRYRERTYELLMQAHYRQGGVAAAIGVYELARRALVEELGVDLGPELGDLRRAVLNRHPDLLESLWSGKVPRQRSPAQVTNGSGGHTQLPPGRNVPAAPAHVAEPVLDFGHRPASSRGSTREVRKDR